MTLFEHLRELRYRLIVSALAILVGHDHRLVLPLRPNGIFCSGHISKHRGAEG
jgi:hypothetical protein